MEDFDKISEMLGRLEPNAPPDLARRIVLAVEKRMRKAAKIRIAVYSLTFPFSIILFYFALVSAGAELYRNGTPQLFSLLFSDFRSVISNWNYFILSIFESLPILPFVYLLSSVLISILLVTLMMDNFKKVEQINHNLKNA